MSGDRDIKSLSSLAGEYGLDISIGVREKGQWIDRSHLVHDNEGEPENYIVHVKEDSQPRYLLVSDNGDINVRERQRVIFSVKRYVDSDEEVDDDVQIIVDVSTDDDTLPDALPWRAKQELRISGETLQRDSAFETVRVNRVAGLKREKQRLVQFLQESEDDWGLSEPTGILLEGPPGTGKTELVMEVCEEQYGSIPVMISGPEILSKWVGESERMLREKFEEAWDTEHKVLYIDELDAIAQSRSEVSESHSAQIVAQLLVLLDGVSAKKEADENDRSLKVVTSTNLSHVIDPALRRPGRLGNRPIQFSHPTPKERMAILHHYLENIYASEDGHLSDELEEFVEGEKMSTIESLVEKTDGFTGADIEDLILAGRRYLREINESNDELSLSNLEHILREEEFGRGQDFSEEIIQPAEQSSNADFEMLNPTPSRPGIARVDATEPEDIAAHYFSNQANSTEEEITYKLRKVDPSDILANDTVRAREQTVQAFQHRKNERIALYLKNTDLLLEARGQSSLVDRLIGVIHEQFLQWDSENLFLLPERDGDPLLEYSNFS